MTAPRVSDHAMVRFLERAGGIDVEQLRGIIAGSLARAHGAALELGGGDHLIVVDGLTFIVRNGVVTTVNGDHRIASKARMLGPSRRG